MLEALIKFYSVTLHRLCRYEEAQKHLEQSKELNPNEKTLVTWLRKNSEKLPKQEIKQEVKQETVTTPAPAPPKIGRYEWFQNDAFVTIEVFLKQVKPENVSLNFFQDSVGSLFEICE